MASDENQVSAAGREDATSTRPSELLTQISNEMVRAQKTYFGRGPEGVKSYLLDDFLLIVMRGGLLTVERTLVDADKEDVVRRYRQEFENEMADRLIAKMQELTGRTILAYQSQILFDPDVAIEIFFFDESAPSEQVQETVDGQVEDGSLGTASDELTG